MNLLNFKVNPLTNACDLWYNISEASDKSSEETDMKNAILWQWAKDQGFTPDELAEAMGYTSPRYVEQVIRGWEKVTAAFIGRFVQAFPDHAGIFLSTVSDISDIISDDGDES